MALQKTLAYKEQFFISLVHADLLLCVFLGFWF